QVRLELENLKQALPRRAEETQKQPEKTRRRATKTPPPEPAAASRNRLGVTVEPGVVVAEVQPETPAAAAGLARGGGITAGNSSAAHGGTELRDAVHGRAAGEAVSLQVTRGGLIREMRARLPETTGAEQTPPADGHNRLGVTVERGVVTAEVLPGTPAAAA